MLSKGRGRAVGCLSSLEITCIGNGNNYNRVEKNEMEIK